jgi:hypothetical protein
MSKYSKNILLIQLMLLTLISMNQIQSYYVLPLKTYYDYIAPESSDKTEIMHNYLSNNIYTELTIAYPNQKLATFIKSRDYCSYIGSYLCNINGSNYDSEMSQSFDRTTDYNLTFRDFDNACLANEVMRLSTNFENYTSDFRNLDFYQFYYAPNNSYSSDNPYSCGVFGFRYKLDESKIGEDKCVNLIRGLNNSSNISFNDIDNLVFSIEYSNEDNDIDGKLIMGNYPHEFAPEKYYINNSKEIYIDETSLEDNKDFLTSFNEIFFYKDNNISNKVSMNNTSELQSVFILEQNMFSVPKKFFDLYVDNVFKKYIDDKKCEVVDIDLERYKTIICQNESSFYSDTFPSLYFYHSGFNETFKFTRKELLVEKYGQLYFMLYVDNENDDGYWGIGKIFMKKYLLTFNYGNNTIKFYNSTEEEEDDDDDDKEEEEKVFDFLENGIYVIIILGANVLVAISCALFGIIHKCTKSGVDPTIMIESFSAPNDEELKNKIEEKEEL